MKKTHAKKKKIKIKKLSKTTLFLNLVLASFIVYNCKTKIIYNYISYF